MAQPDFARPLVVVSNRGPFTFKRNSDGALVPKRGGGGLIPSLAPAVADSGATWISTAATEEDRQAAAAGPIEADGFRLRHVVLEPSVYRQYYDVIANGTLWFLHHNLFDLARRPFIDERWWGAWQRYCEVNFAFAKTVDEEAPEGATVLIHDYHLTLLGKWLRKRRPDLKTMHFHHTPFASRNSIDVLPLPVVQAVLEGLAGHDVCGFNAQRWADSFALGCADHLGYAPRSFVSAAAPDAPELLAVAESPDSRASQKGLDELASGRKLIVRVDRIELSKNIVRGFRAYDHLLRRYPQWRGKVTFAAFMYPSRQSLPEYLAYRNEVESTVALINEEWATPDWQPIVLSLKDDFPHSVAGLVNYDVLLVNPIRDGLNLVAKEGAILNRRKGVVVLSREAGTWPELSNAAIGINPFDIVGTSDALVHALTMSDEERVARSEHLKQVSMARTPHDWLADQLRAVDEAR